MSREVQFKPGPFDFPAGIRLINWLFAAYAKRKLDADECMDIARKRTGLTDFGDPFFEEPLRALIDDINRNTEFHALGAFLYKNKTILNLENRLWAINWLKKEPSINKKLPPKVLITGLQRTGTTFLQRMLGNLPEFRGIVSWEIVNPVPKSNKKSYYGKYQAKFAHYMLNYINPEFKSIHSVKHDSLEEEVVIMDHAFMSTATGAALNVPEYNRWCEEQDQTKVYEDLKMWLKFLMWREPASHFLLLKSPHHMEYLDTFMSIFPDTKIIHTHRDPAKTMGSYCSMVHFGKKLFSKYSDPEAIGSFWLRKNKRLVDHCLAYKADHRDQFIDVSYKALIKDPVQKAKDIYDELGLEWTDQHTSMTTVFCENHRRHKFGKHIYSLSDYGLSEDMIRQTFKDYLDEYQAYI